MSLLSIPAAPEPVMLDVRQDVACFPARTHATMIIPPGRRAHWRLGWKAWKRTAAGDLLTETAPCVPAVGTFADPDGWQRTRRAGPFPRRLGRG